MGKILVKPGITDKGYKTALRDYTEPKVVEELAANSYDADASTVLVLLDDRKNELHIIDDGCGFSTDAIVHVPILGGGGKADSAFSPSKRHYLGAYGFGLKSSINIARSIHIRTSSNDGYFDGTIDWTRLEEQLKENAPGFSFEQSDPRTFHGTWISLRLASPTDTSVLGRLSEHLSDLPSADGTFNCYVGLLSSFPHLTFDNIADLGTIASKAARARKCEHAAASSDSELNDCKLTEADDGSRENKVLLKFFFAGINDGKVNKLKNGLRGIYLRIHGRLLKHNFAEHEYTYNISKWVKFASGLRVEVTADWLRSEITLARDSVRFTNPMLKEQFKTAVQRGIAKFIRQHLTVLERRASKVASRKELQREELARKRANADPSVCVGGLDGGFAYCPETDGELALLVAQPGVVARVNSAWRLIDYNDQAPYDCMLWDSERAQLVRGELEPALTDFLQHRDSTAVELVITWTLGKWRVGATKKGKEGVWRLIADDSSPKGVYKLALLGRSNSKNPPKRHVRVVVLEQLLGRAAESDRSRKPRKRAVRAAR